MRLRIKLTGFDDPSGAKLEVHPIANKYYYAIEEAIKKDGGQIKGKVALGYVNSLMAFHLVVKVQLQDYSYPLYYVTELAYQMIRYNEEI